MSFFDRRPHLLTRDRETQMIVRIKRPWYEPMEVDTKYFGKFRIQLASVSAEGSTIIQISAVPIRTKEIARGSATRQAFGLSGAFETQEQAIYAWETGFVVLLADEYEMPGARDAVLKAMLKKRQAQELTVS